MRNFDRFDAETAPLDTRVQRSNDARDERTESMFVREQQTDDIFEVRDQQDEESAQSTKVRDNTAKGTIVAQTSQKEMRRVPNQLNASSKI